MKGCAVEARPKRWSIGGASAIAASPVPGRPRKLTHTQEKIVERWLSETPTDDGFPTEL